MDEMFGLGDTVQLKSGGPWMTVDHIGKHMMGSTHDEVLCSWFETNKGKRERKQEWFELHSVKKVGPNAESGFYASPSTSIG
ncbi:MAG TPA: DUF2158 domain-containing protein [Candidatus Sulfotelmatobacter sp.]|nr:DUF2158 domain-containing protein [Candidatus Sulfotelmatobacter sp.]